MYIQSEVERKSSRGLIIVIQKKKKKRKTDSKHGRIGRLKLGRPFAFDVAPGLRLVSTLGQKLRPTRPWGLVQALGGWIGV